MARETASGQRGDRGPREEFVADERADGVARQTENEHLPLAESFHAEPERLARPKRTL